MYILRTHLLENPDLVFYYKGTSTEKGVPFALNTIVAFSEGEAKRFESSEIAQKLCEMLNLETEALHKLGFNYFEINEI